MKKRYTVKCGSLGCLIGLHTWYNGVCIYCGKVK